MASPIWLWAIISGLFAHAALYGYATVHMWLRWRVERKRSQQVTLRFGLAKAICSVTFAWYLWLVVQYSHVWTVPSPAYYALGWARLIAGVAVWVSVLCHLQMAVLLEDEGVERILRDGI